MLNLSDIGDVIAVRTHATLDLGDLCNMKYQKISQKGLKKC